MLIPRNINFMFICTKHNYILSMGESQARPGPEMKHPTLTEDTVWQFDLTNARCYAKDSIHGHARIGNECASSWEIRA